MGARLYPFGDGLAPVIAKTYPVAVDPHVDALALQILADPGDKFSTRTVVTITEKDANRWLFGLLDRVSRGRLKPAHAIGAEIAVALATECARCLAGGTKIQCHRGAPFKYKAFNTLRGCAQTRTACTTPSNFALMAAQRNTRWLNMDKVTYIQLSSVWIKNLFFYGSDLQNSPHHFQAQ